MNRGARTLLAASFVLSVSAGGALAQDTEGAAPGRAAEEPQTHQVQRGESLWKIAALTVGDGNLWPALYRANRDQIQNPSILYPGQRLAIPKIAPEDREAIRAEVLQLNQQ